MSTVLDEYRAALKRLKEGCAQVVPLGTRITNDAVALEAGRRKGTIKRSRPVFASLIEEIAAAGADQVHPKDIVSARLKAAKEDAKNFRKLWEDALEREVSLLMELMEARREIACMSGGKVFPIRRQTAERR